MGVPRSEAVQDAVASGAVTQSIQSPWNAMARTGNAGDSVTEAESPG